MSAPTLFGRDCVWVSAPTDHECDQCREPLPGGHWLTVAPTLRFCSAECVREFDNYDGPREVSSEDSGPRDEAHRMQEARKLR
jgi:hypothetical protein